METKGWDEWEKKKKEHPFTCQICGKADETVDMFIGGYINYAHHSCAELAEKGVRAYLRWIQYEHVGATQLARDLIENDPSPSRIKEKAIDIQGESVKEAEG